MGLRLTKDNFDKIIDCLKKEYKIYAPKVMEGKGRFSDTDMTRYGEIDSINDIEFSKKSDFSYKEVLLPITQTLFFFTEDKFSEASVEEKNILIFLRSCDMHSLRRIDDIYLRNGFEDPYYKKLREKAKFIVMGCENSFDNCFCVSMGTNKTDEYSAYIGLDNDCVLLDIKDEELSKLIDKQGEDGKELFESYRDDNPLGAAYEVEAKDPTQLASLAKKIKDIPNVNSVNYGGDSTQSMVSTLNTIQTSGTVFIVGLVIVALFMISNTIKITITARSTEISIMRMVGASNWYIRIPFMLEGMLIGLFGAIIPIFVLVYGYGALYNYTGGSLMSSMLVLKAPMPFIRDFSFILAGLGAGVGLIGSFVSIRRFLKF